MSQKRYDQPDETAVNTPLPAPALGEAARVAAQPPAPSHAKHDDEKMSLFWRVFGGTILSMVAIGAFTLYSSIASGIAELRTELSREREARAELVKKDEFNARTSSQYERIRSFEGLRAEHEGAKARVAANAAAIDELKKDVAARTDAAKKDAAALEILRERVADLKGMRDEVVKIQQELDRNRVADLERKASRDALQKQTEEALKELQKALQDCREKIARLEGALPKAGKTDSDGKN